MPIPPSGSKPPPRHTENPTSATETTCFSQIPIPCNGWAYPDNENPNNDGNNMPPIRVLFLSPQWQFDTFGIASVVRSMATDLWLTDQESRVIKMTCAVLQKDEEIKQVDVDDAKKLKVSLRGIKFTRGATDLPTPKKLNVEAGLLYRDVIKTRFDFIVGHIPYYANAALNIKDEYKDRGIETKVVLIGHAVPRTDSGDVDSDLLDKWLEDADIIFSLGQSMHDEMQQLIDCLDPDKRPVHKNYIPGCPTDLLKILHKERSLKGPKNIIVMTNERKDLLIPGLDFKLAVAATTQALEHMQLESGNSTKVNMMVLSPSRGERQRWEDHFKEIRDSQSTQDKTLGFEFCLTEDLQKLKSIMQRSVLALMPLKPFSSMFGVEALMAAYGAVPILVSRNSGIAELLDSFRFDDPIVPLRNHLKIDSKEWSERIIQKIDRDGPEKSFGCAEELRKELLVDTSIAASNLDFVRTLIETSHQKLVIGLDSDAPVSTDFIADAEKFGVKLEQNVGANAYIAAYLLTLVIHREKLDLELLNEYIPGRVREAWRSLLEHLEANSRRLLDIRDGSLHFILFCSTKESCSQLREETWRAELIEKVGDILKHIGIEASNLRITEPSPGEPTPVKFNFEFNPKFKPVALPDISRLRLKGKRPQPSSAADFSSGYGTASSSYPVDPVSTIARNDRVRDWVDQADFSDQAKGAAPIEWVLDKTIDTGYGKTDDFVLFFAVSDKHLCNVLMNPRESLLLCILLTGSSNPVTLSQKCDVSYMNPVIIKQSGRDHLAAHCVDDNSIHLWDIENRTSRVVYRGDKAQMTLIMIDNYTVGYGNIYPEDGLHSIYILNTSTRPWSLTSTLRLNLGIDDIFDMCFTRHTNGAARFVMVSRSQTLVLMVDMTTGSVIWRVGTQRMGMIFGPTGVCCDSQGNVFVSDFIMQNVVMLSSDGSVVRTVLTGHEHGIQFPWLIRMHNDCLFVSHFTSWEEQKYAISKFQRTEL